MDCDFPAAGMSVPGLPTQAPSAGDCGCGGDCCDDASAQLAYDPGVIDLQADAPAG